MSVRSILETDEKAGLALFEKKVDELKFPAGPKNKLLSMFKAAFAKSSGSIDIVWEYVQPLSGDLQLSYDSLTEPSNPSDLLKQIIIVKLNGGLGTTMGCTFPKSLVECTPGKTFIDLTLDQIDVLNKKYGTNVPLVLMNSFYTDDAMKETIAKHPEVKTFNQNKFPKIYEETLEPVPSSPSDSINKWNPPGHGDVFHSFRDSGLLDEFLKEGKKFMLVSNIDNLGGIPDLRVLNKISSENRGFLAETVTKLKDDWKGGMPILYQSKVKLMETAQVPPEHFKDFTDLNFLDYFNANNLWVNLEKLKVALDTDSLVLDVIKNKKVFEGKSVVQLEAASGSAIQSFPDAICVRVPRRRFLPVKSCSELLLMRGGVFVEIDGEYHLSPKRTSTAFPSVKLGSLYTTVQQFEERVPKPVNVLNLDNLIVNGDVTFGANITIEGDVEFNIEEGQKVTVGDGISLKNVKISKQSDLK